MGDDESGPCSRAICRRELTNRITMKAEFDVLVAGELNADLILNDIHGFPRQGREIIAERMTLTLGSSSAILASNLSALGAAVAFAGRLGDDQLGGIVTESLHARGVDTRFIRRSNEYATGITVCLSYGEDRANLTYPGAMNGFGLQDIPDEAWQAARHMHVSSLFLQPALKRDIIALFARARGAGLSTSLDPQWDPGEKWDVDWNSLFRYVDLFMPNREELMAITHATDFASALNAASRFKCCTVVKDGARGAHVWDGTQFIHHPGYINERVADTIGAGDSFNAGYLKAFLDERPLRECLSFGALMGAVSTTAPGGTGAFYDLGHVKEVAHQQFNYAW